MFDTNKKSTVTIMLVVSVIFTAWMAWATVGAAVTGRYGWMLFYALLAAWNGSSALGCYRRLREFK